MSLHKKIGEHLLCIAIDLAEAHQELLDAQIKVENLALKYNQLIEMQNELENDNNTDNINISDSPAFTFVNHTG
jgi:hypothetical protein